MISQTVLASIARFVAVGGLIAAGAGGVYIVANTRGDDSSKQAIVAATATPTSAASATPAAGSIFVSELKRLSPDLVSPQFSPDGSMIIGGGKNGLEEVAADGSNLRTLEPDATSFSWSPDSKKIAVTVVHGGLTSSVKSADLVVMNADGSSRVDVGKSDFPTYVQFLADGRLAYVRDTRLHLLDPTTGVDTTQTKASPIVNDDSVSYVPFQVSGDGQFVAVVHGVALSIQSLVSGQTQVITTSLRVPPWQPYAWAPTAPVLAYADESSHRVPALHLYDAGTNISNVILQGSEPRGGFYDVFGWVDRSPWLLFAFRPGGTENERGAEYQAIETASGAIVPLFSRGLGGRVPAFGRTFIFFRDPTPSEPAGAWVAALDFK